MKQMKRLCLGILLLVVFTASNVMAEVKIGILDLQRFQQKSVVFKKKKDAFEKKFQPARQKYDQESQILVNLQKEFNKQKTVLSLDAASDKYLEIQAKARYVKFLQDDLNESVKAAQYEAAQNLDKELGEIVKNYARQNGFTVIFGKDVPYLLYSEGSIDITDKVTEIYDKQVKP